MNGKSENIQKNDATQKKDLPPVSITTKTS